MIKKVITTLVALVALVTAQGASAQYVQGRWTVYPHVASTFSNVIETPTKVYMLNGGTLQHLNKADNELYTYSTATLSESGDISSIYYNPEGKYLLITYPSGNIDVLLDNGKVRNLPEIKNAVLTTSHAVNDVTFHDGKIYIATAFGVVIYDDSRFEVKESCIFNLNFNTVLVQQGHLLARTSSTMYYAPLEGRHSQASHFKTVSNNFTSGKELNNNSYIGIFGSSVQLVTYNFVGSVYASNKELVSGSASLYKMNGEGVTAVQSGKIHFIDANAVVTTYTLPAGAVNAFSTVGPQSVWVDNGNGLTQYNLTGSTPVALANISIPEGFTGSLPERMTWSPDGKRLYVNHCVPNWIYCDPGDNMSYAPNGFLDMVEDDHVKDISILNPSQYSSKYKDWTISNGRFTSMSHVVEDPDDPSIVYLLGYSPGLIVLRDRKVEHVFGKYNSAIPLLHADGSSRWTSRLVDLNIDADGNLWVGVGYLDENGDFGTPEYYIIPSKFRKGNIAEIKDEEWVIVPKFTQAGTYLTKGSFSYFCKNSRYKIFSLGGPSLGMVVYDDNGTPLNFNDDKYAQHITFTDTEGNTLAPYYMQSYSEDKDGRIWVGTDEGLFWFKPEDAFNADFRVKRPIVPRNDGTNYGDYLLGTESIFGIAVDPSDRKWIATATSGAYLVNSDGTKIIQNFTTANSLLPSDVVESIAAEPNGNRVYFGTPNGVAAYDSDSAPAADDYSGVYAYPNPVRPDYTGYITVAGLMDNSLVKIADAAGNVFFQGRSEGGMISWDGCDAGGSRVRTGVYFVYASQNGTGSSSGAVAKILVVN